MINFSHPQCVYFLCLLPVFWGLIWWKRQSFTTARILTFAGLRTLVIVLLVLALAGMQLSRKRQRGVSLVFAVDVSYSVPPLSRGWMKNYIERILSSLPDKRQIGLVCFDGLIRTQLKTGNGAQLTSELSKWLSLPRKDQAEPTPTAGGNFTNIESALRSGISLFPGDDSLTRLILLSDGNENVGKANLAAEMASQRGVRIYPVLPPEGQLQDIVMEKLDAPRRAPLGETFRLKVNITNLGPAPAPATLEVRRNNMPIQTKNTTLMPGLNSFNLEDRINEGGCFEYTASVKSPAATSEMNKHDVIAVTVEDKPQILCIDGRDKESSFMAKALQVKGVNVRACGPEGMPSDIYQMVNYDALILNNVSASRLSQRQMSLIKEYVDTVGGGVVMIGGESSYSGGEWAKTPIEEIMPVEMGENLSYKFKQINLILLIDKSSSMEGQKIELARQSAAKAVEELGDNDHIGVIMFDSAPQMLVDMEPIWNNRTPIQEKIRTIQTGKGTNIYPALEMAYQKLQEMAKQAYDYHTLVQHIIVLTDGRTYPGKFAELAARIAKDSITVSSIAIGDEADVELLAMLAKTGKGLFYHPDNVANLPSIFAKEVNNLLTRMPFVEKPFVPQIAADNPMLQGFRQEDIPALSGYMVTLPKPQAQLCLISPARGTRDPILSVWRYGLGQTATYTADINGQWSSGWVGWQEFSRFWSQVVHYIMRRNAGAQAKLEAKCTTQGATLTVQMLSPQNPEGELWAVIWDKTGKKQEVQLKKTEGDKYEADFATAHLGLYIVNLQTRKGRDNANLYTGGVVVSPYYEEYRQLRPNKILLKKLADISGGEYNPARTETFLTPPPETEKLEDIWPMLLAAALVVFVADVALRRLWM